VRLVLTPHPGVGTVNTVRGRLHLDGVRLTVSPLGGAPSPLRPEFAVPVERVGAVR